MSIHRATRGYERWLARMVRLVPADIKRKHVRTTEDKFSFFRGTFFRWAQQWLEWCPEIGAAPRVVSVGDLHIENFGTWRDVEGRLVWGVNDLDEAWWLPYTNDLIRLAASAIIASDEDALSLAHAKIAGAILDGYLAGLEAGGLPFVLAERHSALRSMADARIKNARTYWDGLEGIPPLRVKPSGRVVRLLRRALPEGSGDEQWGHRLAGIGSLGRERITVLAYWYGSRVAREAKALAPSACAWAAGRTTPLGKWHRFLLERAIRCPDPAVEIRGGWIIRRLAPDCSRIDLIGLHTASDERRLLEAMGWETANIHLASRRAEAILMDLKRRKRGWILACARRAVEAVTRDFTSWSNR
jgi:hypothetical protein